MPLVNDRDIAAVLSAVKTIALLGASNKPQRPSYRVMQFLLANNYEVLPVNPRLSNSEILGRTVYGSLAEVPCPIDMVDVFRNSSFLPGIVEEIIELNIGTLWTQLDVVDEQATLRAERHGIRVVTDRCPAIELPRLQQAGVLKKRRP